MTEDEKQPGAALSHGQVWGEALPGFEMICSCQCDHCVTHPMVLEYDRAHSSLLVNGVRVPVMLLELALASREGARILRLDGDNLGAVTVAEWFGESPEALKAERDRLAQQLAVMLAPFAAKAGQA
jgi:hypothetical protein